MALSLTAASYLMLSFSISLFLLSYFCLPQNHFRLTLSSLQHHISLISIAISANRSLFLLYMSKSLFSVMPFHHLPFPLFSESSVILFSFPFWTLNLLRESFRLPWLSTKANISRHGSELVECRGEWDALWLQNTLSLSPLYHSHAYCKDIFYSSQAAAQRGGRKISGNVWIMSSTINK